MNTYENTYESKRAGLERRIDGLNVQIRQTSTHTKRGRELLETLTRYREEAMAEMRALRG